MFYLRWLMFMWFLLECSIPSQASDGNWGPWENTWSICTRSCGGGIRLKRRYCHQGPSKDSCDGEAIQAQLCNIQPCPAISSQYEFKERQCAATNTQPDRLGRYTNWVPFDKVQKNRQCHVVCVPSESPDQKAEVREQSAIDGTICEHDSPTWGFDKCVDGKCQKFGCDGELNSGTFFDVCGICGGTGNSCKKFSGRQTSGKFQEHVTFLTLTGGATSIKIVSSNAYTHIGVRVNGRWLLGPHSGRGKSRLYDSDGVHVQYKGGLSDSEYLSIKSIPNNITVSFSVKQEYDSTQYNGVDPVITYEYYLPTNHVAPAAVGSVQRYRWSLHYITGCTQTCGGG
ncbi:A disintegrin and metalloproteinase with thrombospondin motifs 8-like [Lingula anatina]|uniref:A disintegrin and metalloproteinase with thrombospondin motifs 8-like n=1 Tax=Lingula anatina TaxID=7574 RepID=A0A1S3HBA4_LINAN|nr:A disintegrin and metalloproteinase with thrombospondin motifs 8-like [Lingula anatina]|eukprot:XP_013383310.2 A disintegrin and metalloproteinase with thrombospondin motifs 8-like [Lingula anatina]